MYKKPQVESMKTIEQDNTWFKIYTTPSTNFHTNIERFKTMSKPMTDPWQAILKIVNILQAV
jgi:hypothetical protein